jgi:hypothetical protein
MQKYFLNIKTKSVLFGIIRVTYLHKSIRNYNNNNNNNNNFITNLD